MEQEHLNVGDSEDMAVSLDLIAQDYFNDDAYQQEHHEITKYRNETISYYKHIIDRFIVGELNLAGLRTGLHTLNKDKFWGANGSGFLLEIRKFDLNHAPTNPEFGTAFRLVLDGLDTSSIGRRIEQLYTLLHEENERLAKRGMHQSLRASPRNSAFIISLMALWLDYEHKPYVFYRDLRMGLAALINMNILSAPKELQFDTDGIIISSEQDHRFVVQLLNQLAELVPAIKDKIYWSEYFLTWIAQKTNENPKYFNTLKFRNIEPIVSKVSTATDTKKTGVFLNGEDGIAASDNSMAEVAESGEQQPDANVRPDANLFEDHYLPAISEATLTRAIAEIRRRILVDETLIRRVYHALLNGHVILTGPPGTGKTELARLIPELLWSDQDQEAFPYTTTLVTATSDWNPRTLISSIVPVVHNGQVAFETQYGHLVEAILKNWSAGEDIYQYKKRTKIRSASIAHKDCEREFHGHWLVIDEFNRGPIDIALGEVLTALSNGDALQISVASTPVLLPLPKDFRIIGTLNSFDRNYLNQISEALKRRFAFIEVPPPSRADRVHEQNIVLYKALERCERFSENIMYDESGIIWSKTVSVHFDSTDGSWDSSWEDRNHPLYHVFLTVLWPLFEIIRVYRQLGTAQAITLLAQTLTAGILQGYTEETQWLATLDMMLCDTIADQLQILMPDELEVLLWCLKLDADAFIQRYNETLPIRKPRRQMAHLEALSAILDEKGTRYMTDDQVEQLLDPEQDVEQQVTPEILTEIFHLNHAPFQLPHFTRRLRILKAERSV